MLREHSVILLTFIKLPFVFKTFVLAIFEWPLKTGFTAFIILLKFCFFHLEFGGSLNIVPCMASNQCTNAKTNSELNNH